jgi:hypothetical protein
VLRRQPERSRKGNRRELSTERKRAVAETCNGGNMVGVGQFLEVITWFSPPSPLQPNNIFYLGNPRHHTTSCTPQTRLRLVLARRCNATKGTAGYLGFGHLEWMCIWSVCLYGKKKKKKKKIKEHRGPNASCPQHGQRPEPGRHAHPSRHAYTHPVPLRSPTENRPRTAFPCVHVRTLPVTPDPNNPTFSYPARSSGTASRPRPCMPRADKLPNAYRGLDRGSEDHDRDYQKC